MKVTHYISNTVDRLPRGHVFTYEDFTKEVKSKEAIIKALNPPLPRDSIAGQ